MRNWVEEIGNRLFDDRLAERPSAMYKERGQRLARHSFDHHISTT